ncbi:MAG: NAD(P)H quinone oxidoreductase [Thermodesulfobacteriota bacterium]|nr:MAG: NAD(P)H quinone oxidoreductase [Thermodesulfobacteriota bacterium]
MKAIVLNKTGGPELLVTTDVKQPKAERGEVGIEIEYIGINYAEILSRKGLYGWAGKRPYILGMEASGVINELGEEVSKFHIGQKVIVGTKNGTYAEKIVVPQECVSPILENYTMEENAAFLVNYMTAWVSLVKMAKISPGDKILITAAAGGVGTAAVQIATRYGCSVYGMAGSEEKIDLIKSLGASDGYNYRDKDCFRSLLEDTGGIDVVLEMVGGQVYKSSLDIVNPFGRVVVAGFASLDLKKWNPVSWIKTWRDIPRVKVGDLAKESIAVMSSHLGYLLEEEPAQMEDILNDLKKFIEKHQIKPIIGKVFSFNDAPEAHKYIESRKSFGKVLLKI